MATPLRITNTTRYRVPGTTVGMQVNVFGLSKLEAGVNGEAMAPILLEAMQVPLQDALGNWPVDTGASIDTMETVVSEIGPRYARVVLQVGGPRLVSDPRNKSHTDYAPYIEFNGSPAGRGQGTIANAVIGNDREVKQIVRDGVAEYIRSLLA